MSTQMLDRNSMLAISPRTLEALFRPPEDEEALNQQIFELRARVEELDAFAHMVAHDIKGSLSTVIGFATALQDDDAALSPEERQECLRHLVQSAYKLNNVVDELLLLAEVRRADIVLEPLFMSVIVADAQARLAALIDDYQAVVVWPPAWPVAEGYGPWIEEVWVNYLSNAIKYGGRPPCVQIGAQAQLDGMVRFWVQDNGHGLTPDEQAQLFKPFVRLERVRADGHGLGLSVTQHIVEKLGGHVGVESVPGQGSVFSFTLPGCS
jgi:two-component system sensor histidine kinase/response regulator